MLCLVPWLYAGPRSILLTFSTFVGMRPLRNPPQGDPVDDYLNRVDPNRLGMGVENTFGPMDYIAGAFPVGRVLSPVANKLMQMFGMGAKRAPSAVPARSMGTGAPRRMSAGRELGLRGPDGPAVSAGGRNVIDEFMGKFGDVYDFTDEAVEGIYQQALRETRASGGDVMKRMDELLRQHISREMADPVSVAGESVMRDLADPTAPNIIMNRQGGKMKLLKKGGAY